MNGLYAGGERWYGCDSNSTDYRGNTTFDGNVGAPTRRVYEYNYRNLLTQVRDGNGNALITHTWNGLNQRVETRDSAGRWFRYTYDGSQVANEEDLQDPNGTRAYVNGLEPIARGKWVWDPNVGGGSWVLQGVYFHHDYLGSLVAMTDTNGAVVWRSSADAWGDRLQTTGTESSRREYGGAHGYERNGSGLVDVGVRAYHPALGRFLQRDPVTCETGQMYAYVGSDPANHVDPTGQVRRRAPAPPRNLQSKVRNFAQEWRGFPDPAHTQCWVEFFARNSVCDREFSHCMRGLWAWIPGRRTYCESRLLQCRWRNYRLLVRCHLDATDWGPDYRLNPYYSR